VSGRPPLSETARPRELEQPYRRGHGRVFRLPLTRRALVLGYWEPASDIVLADDESAKLLEAVEGAHIPGITATEIADWARAVDVVAWWDRLVAWMRSWAAADAPEKAVAAQEESWMADQGWSLVPWDGGPDSDLVIDFEDARSTHL